MGLWARLLLALFVLFRPSGVMSACEGEVKYLSSQVDVYAWLENEQKLIYEANPGRWADDPYLRERLNRPEAIRRYEDLSRVLSNMGCDSRGENCLLDPELQKKIAQLLLCEPLPTKYESPLTYGLTKIHLEPLISVARRLYPVLGSVQIGTLPIGAIQAQALVPPGFGSPIIALNRDVFHFTGKFSKAVSAAVPIEISSNGVSLSYDKGKIRERLREHSWIKKQFSQAMFLLVTQKTPSGAEETLLDADHNRLHARLIGGLDAFIIGVTTHPGRVTLS